MAKVKSTSGSLVFGPTGAVYGLGGAGELRTSARFPRSVAATQANNAAAVTRCRRCAGDDTLCEVQFEEYSQVGWSIEVSEQSINASASQTIVGKRDCQFASAKVIAIEGAHDRTTQDQNAARSRCRDLAVHVFRACDPPKVRRSVWPSNRDPRSEQHERGLSTASPRRHDSIPHLPTGTELDQRNFRIRLTTEP
jgi:hypothetical protein